MFRAYLKDSLLPTVCSCLPSGLLQSVADAAPSAAYYHIVSDQEVPHVKHLYRYRNVASFERDLDAFAKRFTFVSVPDLLSARRSGQSLRKNSLLLSFDDGFSEMSAIVAPILLRKGISATFFLISGCIDNQDLPLHNKISVLLEHLAAANPAVREEVLRLLHKFGMVARDLSSALLSINYTQRELIDELAHSVNLSFSQYLAKQKPFLASDQVRDLINKGFSFGGHSIDHPMYSLLPLEEQVRQTCESVAFVRKSFNLDYGLFAFPHGDEKVSADYFRRVADAKCVDLSFGTKGIVKEGPGGHFQRFSMENTSEPAAKVLGWFYARALFKR